jgi:group I intron endonuclease
LISKNHHSIKLQRAYNKYGIDNFIYEIIEECNELLLIEREQYWIDSLNSCKNGYNSSPTAGSPLGIKRSKKSKKKYSISKIGDKNPMFKRKMSDEMMFQSCVKNLKFNKSCLNCSLSTMM